jgi:hypothetical protein
MQQKELVLEAWQRFESAVDTVAKKAASAWLLL